MYEEILVMVRKIVFGALIAIAIGGVCVGKDFFSYARTGIASARERFRSEIPIEFEIRRARDAVARLLPEVRKSIHLIAQEQVEVAQLKASIASREAMLKSQQEAIQALADDLKQEDVRFVYAGRKYSRSEVENDLAERFNRYKIAEETLKREQELLASKERALAANRDTLEGMLSQRKSLEVELERLEARLRTVDARKQIHGLEIDNSQLARVKSMIAAIEKRLDIEDAVLAAEGDLTGLIPVEQSRSEENENIVEEVSRYFQGNSQF